MTFTQRSQRALRGGLFAASVTGLALLVTASPAQAQDKAAAESLFQAGKSLMADGKPEEACPKFEASQRADPSAGTLLNLARCHETIGKTATAWAEYKEAATTARTSGRTDIVEAATGFAKALEPKLSKLSISATQVPGLIVKRDGNPISLATLGVPIAVDPGEHEIEASAPGYAPYTTKITVGADGKAESLQIPALTESKEEIGGAGTPAGPAKSGPLRTVSYIVGGAGVVGLGLGTIFGVMASSQASNAESTPTLCPNKQCTKAGLAEIDSASTKATISTVGFIGGGALLATGVVLFLVSSPKKVSDSGTTAHFVPSVGPDGGGFSVLGRF